VALVSTAESVCARLVTSECKWGGGWRGEQPFTSPAEAGGKAS